MEFLQLFSVVSAVAARRYTTRIKIVKLAIIANPYAGGGRARSVINDYRKKASSLDFQVSINLTIGPKDATGLAARLAGKNDVIGVIGGDGTVHEVVAGLMPDPKPIIIVPAGSANDLASVIRCPGNVKELDRMIQEGRGTRLDVVQMGDRYCVNSAGFGFEGRVNQESHDTGPLWTGTARYLVAVLRTLRSLSCPFFDITASDGTRIQGEKLLVSIGNGNRAGGAFHITPDASPDDGLVDVCVIDAMKWTRVLTLLPTAISGKHVGRPEVRMLRVPSLEIETNPKFPMHIDGQLLDKAPQRTAIAVRHRVLPIICGERSPNRLTHPLEKIL
jgi:YegS/Rv2252/BmrU family lipid kinase